MPQTSLPVTPNNPLADLEVIVADQKALQADRARLLAACRAVDKAADKIILDAETAAELLYGGHMPQYLAAAASTARTLRNLVAEAIRAAGLVDVGRGG